jgi:hypothetical protein
MEVASHQLTASWNPESLAYCCQCGLDSTVKSTPVAVVDHQVSQARFWGEDQGVPLILRKQRVLNSPAYSQETLDIDHGRQTSESTPVADRPSRSDAFDLRTEGFRLCHPQPPNQGAL